MSKLLTIGIIGKSLKKDEKRVAIHPEHLKRIKPKFRKQLTFESGYGSRFGWSDKRIAKLTSGKVADRKEIYKNYDCVLMPKPLPEDLQKVRNGAIVWGWPHCVQQRAITQAAIDRKLTLIAWEEMFLWSGSGEKRMHVFYKNNELAGYASVNHAIGLLGFNGNYGRKRKVAVLGFGSVSRGAIYALQGQGFKDIVIYTDFPFDAARDKVPGIPYKQMEYNQEGTLLARNAEGKLNPLIEDLAKSDLIVNGILQNVEKPYMFVPQSQASELGNGTLIIDISCDEGMGFWCAKPTSFENPMFKINGVHYYSVDHSPSYYWDSASWAISEALLAFLPVVLGGKKAWDKNETIHRAIEIEQGVILNPRILSFQNREKSYPHESKKLIPPKSF